jgi:hypothetical protein
MPGVGKPNTATSVAATGSTLTSSDLAELSPAQAALPYSPSWMDRLTDWIDRLPGPAWLYYAGVSVALVLIRAAAAWSDGSYAFGDFFSRHVLDAVSVLYFLFVLHYLDNLAGTALSDFRPVLKSDDAGYETLRFQLTTMPARPVLVWSVFGLVFGLAQPLMITGSQIQEFKLYTSPAATVFDLGTSGLAWMINAIFAYHTIRQLRLVSRIYTVHTNVNIFETGPLYALSRVTALTAISILLITYFYADVSGGWRIETAGDAMVASFFTLGGFATFVWPLWGAHRLLQHEKAQRKGAVARRMEAITNELHSRLDRRDLKEMDRLKDGLDSLVVERSVLDKVSTWPWEPETARVVVTAVLLPMILWVVTRILERFLGL